MADASTRVFPLQLHSARQARFQVSRAALHRTVLFESHQHLDATVPKFQRRRRGRQQSIHTIHTLKLDSDA